MHSERGLADPRHPADRVDAHHTARTRRGLRQLFKFLLAPGERGDITRQRPSGRRSGARSSVPRLAGPRDRLEPRSGRADQAQRIGQQPSSILVCPPADPPLQVTDRTRAQACRLRQLFLRQPRRHAQLSQQPAEIKRRPVGHGPPSPRTLRPRCQARRSPERPAPSVRGARNLDHRLAQFSQAQTGSHRVPRAGRQASLSWAGLALTQSIFAAKTVAQSVSPFSWRPSQPLPSAVATNVHRFGHAALGLGWPQRCWRSLRMRARSRRWAARTSGWRA